MGFSPLRLPLSLPASPPDRAADTHPAEPRSLPAPGRPLSNEIHANKSDQLTNICGG